MIALLIVVFFAGIVVGAGATVLIATVIAAGSRSDAKWR